MQLIRHAAGAVAVLRLCGCAHRWLQGDYVPDKRLPIPIESRAGSWVYDQSDDDRLVTAGATSFTGSA